MVLKKNKYKTIELIQREGGESYIEKTFSGHLPSDCRRNAEHTFLALNLLRKQFSDLLLFPKPLGWDSKNFSVQMEFLPDLDQALPISISTIHRTFKFFERCYHINSDCGFLPHILKSVHLTNRVNDLIHSDFPLCLGFKGDLQGNLNLLEDGLVLADVETACMEPMGLSETILYIDILFSHYSLGMLLLLWKVPATPVAFRFLSPSNIENIIEAAIEFFVKTKMKEQSSLLRICKEKIARRFLRRFLSH